MLSENGIVLVSATLDKNTKKVTISSKGLKAATAINNAWMESFPNVINRKVKGANFALLRLPDCVSVLTELISFQTMIGVKIIPNHLTWLN